MPNIAVARPFTLILDNGERRTFAPGYYKNVEPEIAGHWYTKLFLAADDQVPDTAETVVESGDALGIQTLVQARVAAEEAAERLRAEVRRLTDNWSEADLRARRAEAQVAELGQQVLKDPSEEDAHNTALADMTRQRDEAHARIAELESSTDAATRRVEALTAEMQASPAQAPSPEPVPAETAVAPEPAEEADDEPDADEVQGDYVVRKTGRKYGLLKLNADGTVAETIVDKVTKTEAEAKLREIQGA